MTASQRTDQSQRGKQTREQYRTAVTHLKLHRAASI